MRSWFLALVVVAAWCGPAVAQEDKKTDDDKPADPDTGESTVQEKTLGLLPNLRNTGSSLPRPISARPWATFREVSSGAPL